VLEASQRRAYGQTRHQRFLIGSGEAVVRQVVPKPNAAGAEDSMKRGDGYVQYSDDSDSDIRTFLPCGADIYPDRDNGDSGVSDDTGTVSAGNRVDIQADKGLFSRKGVKKLFDDLFDAVLGGPYWLPV
jgi:hypothetical protein